MAGRLTKVQQLERDAAAAAQRIPLMPCGRGGCKNPAQTKFNDRWLCFGCRNDLKSEESRKFCEAKGLRTIDEKREYCKSLARTFGRGPTFEEWAQRMTQHTVDLIERMDGDRSKTLERLRAAGVIDGRNKLIPLEARKIAADAYAADRARLICEQRAFEESSAGQAADNVGTVRGAERAGTRTPPARAAGFEEEEAGAS